MYTTQIEVFGKVQGVAFRYYTKIKADKIGLRGTVENLHDGSVLIHCHGTKADIQLLLDWCIMGSPAAHVTHVIETEVSSNLDFKDFSILRSHRK